MRIFLACLLCVAFVSGVVAQDLPSGAVQADCPNGLCEMPSVPVLPTPAPVELAPVRELSTVPQLGRSVLVRTYFTAPTVVQRSMAVPVRACLRVHSCCQKLRLLCR